MADDLELPSVDAITVGTVGEPGNRVFYLQLWTGGRIVSLKLEKMQVAALASVIAKLLEDLPPIVPAPLPDLLDPGAPDWVVGSMALTTYDDATERAYLILNEFVAEDDDEGATARIGVTLPQLAALASLGDELVEAGRPPCPLCGRPMDPAGHVCPKTNGTVTR